MTTFSRLVQHGPETMAILRREKALQLLISGAETAGGVLKDHSPNRYHGTLVGSPTQGVALTGGFRGVALDGASQYVTFGDLANLSFERTGAFSGVCVLNPNVSANGVLIGKMNGLAAVGWLWGILSTRAPFLDLQVTDTTNECLVTSNTVLTNGTAVMIGFSKAAGTGAASEVAHYINGVAVADTDIINSLASGSLDNAVGVVIGATVAPDTYLNANAVGLLAMFNEAKTAQFFRTLAAISGFL